MLDYYDGPRYGVFRDDHGECYVFQWMFEEPDSGLQTFCVARLLHDSAFERIERILGAFMTSVQAVWTPLWHFPNVQAQRDCEAQLDVVINAAESYSLEIKVGELSSVPVTAQPLSLSQRGLVEKFLANGTLPTVAEWSGRSGRPEAVNGT